MPADGNSTSAIMNYCKLSGTKTGSVLSSLSLGAFPHSPSMQVFTVSVCELLCSLVVKLGPKLLDVQLVQRHERK